MRTVTHMDPWTLLSKTKQMTCTTRSIVFQIMMYRETLLERRMNSMTRIPILGQGRNRDLCPTYQREGWSNRRPTIL
jgi:nitrogen regulatory protein PII